MRTRLSLIVLAPLLLGCGAEVTSQGNMVRQMSMRDVGDCKFLGVVEGSESFGWTVSGDRRSALNKVRNNTAAKGGNTFVLNDTISSGLNTSMQAEAYYC